MRPFKQHSGYSAQFDDYRDFLVVHELKQYRSIVDESNWLMLSGVLAPDIVSLTVSENVDVLLLPPESTLLSKANELHEKMRNGYFLNDSLAKTYAESYADY